MLLRFSIFISLTIVISIVTVSCNKNKDVNSLADTFCNCAQPIVEWKQGLEFHYEKLAEEGIVRAKVDSCLSTAKKNFSDKKDDKEFQKAVTDKVNEQCPEANASVLALFKMLFVTSK